MISKKMNEVLRNTAILADQTWVDYAAYCRARESGLRRSAFQHLSAFIASAKVADVEHRRKFVHWLCEQVMENQPDSGALTPEPLLTEIVIPTLDQWRAEEPQNSIPLRWLGVLFTSPGHLAVQSGLRPPDEQGESFLRRAIDADPMDQIARIQLIECRIGTLDFHAHHLPEAYLGDPQLDLSVIAEAETLLAGVSEEEQKTRLSDQLRAASQLIRDWIESRMAGVDFTVWCREHGRDFAPLTRIYVYDRSKAPEK